MKTPFFKLAERSGPAQHSLPILTKTKIRISQYQSDADGRFITTRPPDGRSGHHSLNSYLHRPFDYLSFEPSGYGMLILAVGSVIPFAIPTKKKAPTVPWRSCFIISSWTTITGKKLLGYQIKGVAAENQSERKYSRVLITGLARAGTTALTKELAKRGPFASLDYSNMPVISPKL